MSILEHHVGAWSGTHAFRLMPTDPATTAPAAAVVTLGAAARLACLAYTWSHPEDGPQEGMLTWGADPATGEVTALWGDSWHQAPAPRVLVGGQSAPPARAITVGYAYTDDGWRWQVTIDASDLATLRVRMDNLPPEGPEPSAAYVVMQAELRRPAG